MLNLPRVTLTAISSVRLAETENAINRCLQMATFGDVKLFSHKPFNFDAFETTIVPEITSIAAYSTFVCKELPRHIATDYCLHIQWDGFIVNPSAWSDRFYDFDYIGAPWPWLDNLVGNGGFAWRSAKLLTACLEVFADIGQIESDDNAICQIYRRAFVARGVRFAPVDIGYMFSTEHGDYNKHDSFGFHGAWHASFMKPLGLDSDTSDETLRSLGPSGDTRQTAANLCSCPYCPQPST